MIGLLLMQDFLAIFALLIIFGIEDGRLNLLNLGKAVISLPLLVIFCHLFVRFLITPLIKRFDHISEFIFLLTLGWSLGVAHLAEYLHLSTEIGAFIAGITLASTPIAQYIALHLKPLRDFFLIIFFFAIGAGFNFNLLAEIAIPASILAVAIIIIKPVVFHFLIKSQSERNDLAWDVGFRLGQISEFSLLILIVANNMHLISDRMSVMMQATTILTFLISSYIIIFNYPTPMAISDRLRRD